MEPRLNLNKNEDIRPLPKDSVDGKIFQITFFTHKVLKGRLLCQ